MQEEQAEHEREAISDDQMLLADLESLARARPMPAALKFVGGGEGGGVSEFDKLNRFLERNDQFMSDGRLDSLKKAIKFADLQAKGAAMSGDAKQAAGLKTTIVQLLIPIVKEVVQGKVPQKRAPAGTEVVPSTERAPNPVVVQTKKKQAERVIKEQVKPAYKATDTYKRWVALYKALKQDPDNHELRAETIRRKIALSNKKLEVLAAFNEDGILDSYITGETKNIQKMNRTLAKKVQELKGHGAAQALSSSMGRRETLQKDKTETVDLTDVPDTPLPKPRKGRKRPVTQAESDAIYARIRQKEDSPDPTDEPEEEPTEEKAETAEQLPDDLTDIVRLYPRPERVFYRQLPKI